VKVIETGGIDWTNFAGRIVNPQAVAFRQEAPDPGQPASEPPLQTSQTRLDLLRNGEEKLVILPSVQSQHRCFAAHARRAR
jgi:hypothetical protein